MKRMSWGTFPTYEEFQAAFERELGEKRYRIQHGLVDREDHARPVEGDYTCLELWNECQRLWASDCDEGQWVSDILGTLGFEWI